MSVAAVDALFECDLSQLDAGAKVQLVYLAWRADDDGIAWPSRATIAAALNIDERTVKRNSAKLEQTGWLVRHLGGQGAGDPNRYQLTYRGASKKGDATAPLNGDSKGDAAAPLKGDAGGNKGDAGGQNGGRSRPPIDKTDKTDSKQTERGARARGSRTCPGDWQPTKRDRAWAIDKGLTNDQVDQVAERIHACEFPKPRRDWSRVFKSWILRGLPRGEFARKTNGSDPTERRPNESGSEYWSRQARLIDEREARDAEHGGQVIDGEVLA